MWSVVKDYPTKVVELEQRFSMVRPGPDALQGVVEVDQTCRGGLEEGAAGRQTEAKALIAVAAEAADHRMGRIRLRRMADASAHNLREVVEQAIESGSVVRTDAWPGHAGVEQRSRRHEVRGMGQRRLASERPPRVHRVVRLLKRWLTGTYQGAVSHAHVADDLDEWVFRFNRRPSASRGKLFDRLIQQAVQVGPQPYRTLIHPPGVGGLSDVGTQIGLF